MDERDTLTGDVRGASAPPQELHGMTDPGPGWRSDLAGAIRDPDELWRLLDLPAADLPAARRAAKLFPLLVPRGFAALMRPGDLRDPLLMQVLPINAETQTAPGFTADPLQESGCAPVPGLLTKYHGRALLVATGACAVHCRYCFRRHFPYDDLPRGRGWWAPALARIRADDTLNELILSGGDPLTLPDAQLSRIAADAAAIPHLTRLRIHSRLPVVLPARIDDAFIGWFTNTRLRPVLVMHANHAREISPAVVAAIARLRAAAVTVLNQSVLLKGINDDAAVLADLSESLFAAGVLPYYLHALDHVAGAAHFLIGDDRAADIMRDLAARLPGYLVPRLVRERPGRPGKDPLPW